MDIQLTGAEARVLGSLIEKDITTPDYYPLSLNALVNACNQKSNREPVMELDEDAVRGALGRLQEHGLAGLAGGADSRVTKYEHRLQEVFNFDRRETAVLCVLLLRGAQTPGELRGRTERMHRFEDLSEVLSTLQRLIDRGLARMLPRQPGTKEARYVHLLSACAPELDVSELGPAPAAGAAAPAGAAGAASAAAASPDGDRLARLEVQLARLQTEVADLKHQFADFRKQFE